MNKHQILNDIRRLSNEELQELYGIEIDEDGQVFDLTEQQLFKNLTDWANFLAEQEWSMCGGKQKFGGKHYFDDDF